MKRNVKSSNSVVMIFVLLYTLCLGAQGQSCSAFYWENSTSVYYVDNRDFIKPDLIASFIKAEKSCLAFMEKPEHKAKICNSIASRYHIIKGSKDSIVKYMILSHHYDRKWFCRVACTQLFLQSDEMETYYMYENDVESHCSCDCTDYPKTLEAYKKQKNDIDKFDDDSDYLNKEYARLLEIDQRHRIEHYDPVKQKALDKQNRIKLDSLYNIYGIPNSKINRLALWLIVQHSGECAYMSKWLSIFKKQYLEDNWNLRDLKYSLKRYREIAKLNCWESFHVYEENFLRDFKDKELNYLK